MSDLISIIIPCRNEERYIANCLEGVLAFECPAGVAIEVLVMDGRSTDATAAAVRRIADRDARVRLHDNPGLIQSAAMNRGVRLAAGRWIMRLDAHAEYPRDYLRRCYDVAQRSGADNAGGGIVTLAGGSGYSAQLVQALTTHKFGVGNSGFRTGAGESWADTVPFGFFRREVFDRIGWFDERLVRAQDYEFNRRLGAAGGRIRLSPEIQARYYNQPTLSAFLAKQFFKEAPYNAYMWYLARYTFTPRHAVTAVFTGGVLAGLLLAPWFRWAAWGFGAVMALYAALAVASACQQALRYRRAAHVIFLPVGFFLYHFCHGAGVLVGLAALACRRAPVMRAAEPWPGAGFRFVTPGRLAPPAAAAGGSPP